MTDCVTVTSLPASLIQTIRSATSNLCQIALDRELSHPFREWCKFSNRLKTRSRTMNSRKTRPARIPVRSEGYKLSAILQ
jgi:hypothetical protein